MNNKYKFYSLIAVIVSLLIYWRGCVQERTEKASNSPLSLSESVRAIVHPAKHSVDILQPGRDIHSYFVPDNGATIDIFKNGSYDVVAKQYGFEHRPFMTGNMGSDFTMRAGLGCQLFYYHLWELGSSVLFSNDIKDTRVALQGTYNFYANWIGGIGIDQHKTIHLVLGLKF